MALKCANCDQTILPTDTVCWHCGQELKPGQDAGSSAPKTNDSVVEEGNGISLTAVSIFALITLITILLFIIITYALAG